MPAGFGDALMAYFTCRLVGHWGRTYAAIAGQLSRYIFTSGMVALCVGLAVATGVVSPADAPVSGLTSSALGNIFATWKAISYPAVTLSIAFNIVASVLIILLFGKRIQKILKG